MSTDYLYSIPSFFYGAARTLDLFGQFDQYNSSSTPEEADSRAMISDMLAVASDIRCAEAKVLDIAEKKK